LQAGGIGRHCHGFNCAQIALLLGGTGYIGVHHPKFLMTVVFGGQGLVCCLCLLSLASLRLNTRTCVVCLPACFEWHGSTLTIRCRRNGELPAWKSECDDGVHVQYRLWWSLREERPVLVQISVSTLSLVVLTMPLVVWLEEMVHWRVEQGAPSKKPSCGCPVRPGLLTDDESAKTHAQALHTV
jgi:hypothetical protein